ncbi:hypothetical protein GW17_00033145 [Ensete ventricosum]|nr:hypothetical protein GW17_00033145 [Ensete ventricosum]
MGARGFFVGARGMCKLLGTSVGRSGTQVVASWNRLLVLGGATVAWSFLRCSGGVAYPRFEDLVWLASAGGAFLFASASFRSSVGSPVVDTCTKAVVEGARCCPNSALLMVKSTR